MILTNVAQIRIVAAVVQAHAVRFVAIVVRRTPEVRVVALAVVTPTVASDANRVCREREGFRAVAPIFPTE